MMLFHPWILDSLGILLLAVGAAGLAALSISEPMRPVIKRTVGTVCTMMAVGGALLMVRAETMLRADRDLSPAEQADLASAISQFSNLTFEVVIAHTDNETRSLASKIADAIKTGTGIDPIVGEMPPSAQKGVVIVFQDRKADIGRAVIHTIGRALMAARIACITHDEPGLDDRSVRILVGRKP